jgi:hypothetical protein
MRRRRAAQSRLLGLFGLGVGLIAYTVTEARTRG